MNLGIQVDVIGNLDGVTCTELLSRCVGIIGEEPGILMPAFSFELLEHYDPFRSLPNLKLRSGKNQKAVDFSQFGSLNLDELTSSFSGPSFSLL